ncbi:hypothetical protein EXE48_11450 [Halorubrum sp. ASP1]|uniref:hypothetical protein n=1 Tax=Halorubrum sp. ASP1 TaxID=2518114 RepID=UPI0010F7E503|nr:hypothetical protein [Halorubrum sp. ASP1]TKX60581.1 hypothetical protein EXE48_11450 [Halorubrum sp. ASP1]
MNSPATLQEAANRTLSRNEFGSLLRYGLPASVIGRNQMVFAYTGGSPILAPKDIVKSDSMAPVVRESSGSINLDALRDSDPELCDRLTNSIEPVDFEHLIESVCDTGDYDRSEAEVVAYYAYFGRWLTDGDIADRLGISESLVQERLSSASVGPH